MKIIIKGHQGEGKDALRRFLTACMKEYGIDVTNANDWYIGQRWENVKLLEGVQVIIETEQK